MTHEELRRLADDLDIAVDMAYRLHEALGLIHQDFRWRAIFSQHVRDARATLREAGAYD